MCGRYSLATHGPEELSARFGLTESLSVEPRFNIAPGAEVPVITTDRAGRPHAQPLRWGLVPGWAQDPRLVGFKMINARAETLSERPAFRTALERFRCLIPADGFYEWRRGDGAPKQPFHVARADGALFAFAGLWSVWHRGGADELRTFTIVTTKANAAVAPLHDRMPVILPRDAERAWLAPDTAPSRLRGLLVAAPADALAPRAVGPAVNDARNDGPECLADPLLTPTQGILF